MVINLTHCIALTRAAAPMIGAAGGGAISFVGSVAGLGVMARLSTYGAAKAGLHHFIKSAAFELGPQGVRVNAVSPGYVQTPRMLERLSAEGWQDITDATPLRRAGRPSDIASSVLFLSSDLGGFVTGQNLVTDGGVTLAYRVLRAPPGV